MITIPDENVDIAFILSQDWKSIEAAVIATMESAHGRAKGKWDRSAVPTVLRHFSKLL